MATVVQEFDAIRAMIQHYIDGAQTGQSAEMKKELNQDATRFGYIGPEPFAGPIQGLYDWHDGNGAATELEIRVVSVDAFGTGGNGAIGARLEIDNWTGHRFTDFFTLLKAEGEWKVVNKVFHLHG